MAESISNYNLDIRTELGTSGEFISLQNLGSAISNKWLWIACQGNLNSITINNQKTKVLTGVIKNEFDTTTAFALDAPRNFTVAASSTTTISTLKSVHYRILNKIIEPVTNIISTQGWYLVNNKTVGPFSAVLTNVCYTPTMPGNFQFKIDVDRAISGSSQSAYYNFPGYTYEADWDDQSANDIFTIQYIDYNGGVIDHGYNVSSCSKDVTTNGQTYKNSIGPSLKVLNINPPCASTVNSISPIQVFQKPIISFTAPTEVCQNTSVTFTNTSNLGLQGTTDVANCSIPAITYEWLVDGVVVATTESYTTSSLSLGTHSIKLNPIFSINGITCLPEAVTKTICIQPQATAAFTVNGLDSVVDCAPKTITIVNTTPIGLCTTPTFNWQVSLESTPTVQIPINTGIYTVMPNSNTQNPTFVFNTPGRYIIRLSTTNSCGNSTITKKIIILGTTGLSLPANITYCANGKTIDFGNNINHMPVYSSSGAGETYNWSITGGAYSFTSGTSATSRYPIISFADNVTYTINLTFTNNCGTNSKSQTINFLTAVGANVGVSPKTISVCYNENILQLNGTASGGYSSVLWTSNRNGTFTNSAALNPIYTFGTTDKLNLTTKLILKVNPINNSCQPVYDTLDIIFRPQNIVTSVPNKSICSGGNVNYVPFASQTGSTFSWTATIVTGTVIGLSASGVGNINDFLTNTSNSVDAVVRYRIVPIKDGCNGDTLNLIINIKPKPILTVTPSSSTICSGQTLTINLSSTALAPIYTWYSVANGAISGNTNQTTPSSNAVINNSISTASSTDVSLTYTINSTSNNCATDTQTVVIIVKPGVSVSIAGADQKLCNSTITTLSGNNPAVGLGTWTQVGTPLATIIDSSMNNTNISGLTANNSYQFVWTISGIGSCPKSTDTVNIINRPAITIANAGLDKTICDFVFVTSNQITLVGNSVLFPFENGLWSIISQPTGGNGTFSNNSSPISNFIISKAGTYVLQWEIKNDAATCPSKKDTVEIKVIDKVVSGILSASSLNICNGNSVTITNQNYIGQVQLWQFKRPYLQSTWTDTLIQSPTITFNNVTDTFLLRSKVVSKDSLSCISYVYTDQIQINVAPPSNAGTTNTSKTECKGSNNGIISLTGNIGRIVRWESSQNSGTSWTFLTNTNPTQSYTNLTQTTWYRAVIQSGTCNELFSTVTVITIINEITTPVAGNDQKLCNSTSAILTANSPASNENGTWSLVNGSLVSFSATNTPTTTISGLQIGSYTFIWTIDNGYCSPQTDSVKVVVYPLISNVTDTTTITICANQPITIIGQVPNGGNTSYAYVWQQSIDNISWTNMTPSQTGVSLTFTPINNIYVRRVVTSGPCISNGFSKYILVQPAISNNTVSTDQNICINTSANNIIGTTPNGGNGNFSYQWQQSIDGGTTWSNIILATSKDYSPGIITATTQYRRIVSTTLCSGTQGNTSTVVTVKVNPDAKAVFTFTRDRDCAPFNINSGTIAPTLYPSQNSVYNWFANGISIGSGAIFPGYLLSNPGDSVTIKLVALSQFGCKNDSMQHKFFSVPKAFPAFTLSDTVGCAPLAISFSNTTPNSSLFTYLWNFGNGITSTLTQPNNVIFTNNPNYNDTNYIVKLSAITACETVVASKNIRVKSKPKSIFTPNKSTGCSPMTVQFSNLSKGVGVNYIWNFDDGSAIVSVANNAAQTHTFITGIQDTFNVKLIAINDCGNDTSIYKIVVAPNTVRLDFAVNGNQLQGCKPHTINFINASSGATTFQWNFGDGNFLNTVKNFDTVSHTYTQVGTYTVVLKASNGCSDTTTTETIQIFNSPIPNFTAVPLTACIGESIQFTNQTDTSTSLLWNFKDNSTSTVSDPVHLYSIAGTYQVQLKAYRQYSSGLTCIDSISKPVIIVNKLPGTFTASSTTSDCVPFTVTFVNQSLPSNNTLWNFGNGSTASGNVVSFTYTQVGVYTVKMTAVSPGGCTYEAIKVITVRGPAGTWQYDHGNICNTPVRFTAATTNTDSIKYNFGDGTFLTTIGNTIYHSYTQAGSYVPTATLYSSTSAACTVVLQGIDTIKVDYIKAGFKFTKQEACGITKLQFTDTSRHYLSITSWNWKFGDGAISSLQNPEHSYAVTNNYTVQLITTTISGCSDTVSYNIFIKVNDKPSNTINATLQGCTGQIVNYTASSVSIDTISFNNWSFSNGLNTTGASAANTYNATGNYAATLITGTVFGCTDTATHVITINPTPIINTTSSQLICKGQSLPLTASGAPSVTWSPIDGSLSCTVCATTVASPLTTTQYIATGTNSFGCTAKDSVIIKVAQPIEVIVSKNDTICIGSSSQLSVSGASTYAWSPSATLQQPNTATPIATPSLTTIYSVIGFDNHNCFQDTGYVTVAVGQYPTINLGVDQTLATGTRLTLTSTFTNGPITNWLWSPATDLNCTTCPQPIATVKKGICYSVTASNLYKCPAKDTMCIKVFCENSQLFIPNGFSPDGDGVNDILVIRGSGIKTVKSFRIFNRWGQVVFEKSNISPNDVLQGWDGKIKGVAAPPDVFVYTCEVICDNDVSYTYKGNVAILK